MTKVSFISGIPSSGKTERYGTRTVPKKRQINYTYLSEGELRLELLRDRMEILEKYYPESPEYKQYRKAFEESLKGGLHSEGKSLSGIGFTPALSIVQQAKRMTQPAVNLRGGWFGLGSPADDCRQEKNAVMDAQMRFMRAAFWNKKKRQKELDAALAELETCTGILQMQQVLNAQLEDSGHHLLYHFVKNANSVPNVVSAKSVNHRVAVGNFARVSGLSMENVVEWITNGIMRNNAKRGVEPFTPDQTIEILATEIPEQSSISGPFLVALPKIIAAIAAAVGATVTLVNSLNAQKQIELQANLQGLGTVPFGPEQEDWYSGQGGGYDNAGGMDYMPLLLAGGALLLLSK